MQKKEYPTPDFYLLEYEEQATKLPSLVQELSLSLQNPNRIIDDRSFHTDIQNIVSWRSAIKLCHRRELISSPDQTAMMMTLHECETRIQMLRLVITIAFVTKTKLNNLHLWFNSNLDPYYYKNERVRLNRLFGQNSGDKVFNERWTIDDLDIDATELTAFFDQFKDKVGLNDYSLATVMAAVRLASGYGTIAEAGHLMMVAFPGLEGQEPDLFLRKS